MTMSGHNGDQSGERALEVGERVVAAGSAAVLASVLCNPLEVVKVGSALGRLGTLW